MTTNEAGSVRFLFDYISPSAYLAWMELHTLAAQFHRRVEPVPVLFAGLLQAHGTRGPAEVPAKRAYVIKDVLRRANAARIPISLPPTHPFNPLLALRATLAPMDDSGRRKLIDGLYAAVWGGGGGVTEPEAVAAIIKAAGLDSEAVLLAASGREVKDKLRKNTEEAIAQGVFGVPTLFVDGEMFWGHDSLPLLARYLAGEQRLDPSLIAKWATLPASAVRPNS